MFRQVRKTTERRAAAPWPDQSSCGIAYLRAASCPSWITSPPSFRCQPPTANCQPPTANYFVNCHSQDAMLLANCIVPASVHAANQRYVPAG